MSLKQTLFLTTTISLLAAGGGAYAQTAPNTEPATGSTATAVTDIVVTAERRAENIQTVPIAVSAFNSGSLQAQRIDSGANLVQAVPNMGFQPGAFGKPNFTIRGIGYQLVTSAGDAGVAVHENDAPVSAPRIARAEFFDIERVEVLRGPQGTLYGRNATGGVVNVITHQPTFDHFEGSVTDEYGSYNTLRTTGYLNMPLSDTFAVRVAGDFLQRDGFQTNVFNGDRINGTNLYSTRITLGFRPNPNMRAYLMWEHFSEDDNGGNNGGNGASACRADNGPNSVGGVDLTSANPFNTAIRQSLSFGCTTAERGSNSIYAPGVIGGHANGVGVFGNRLGNVLGLSSGDLFAGNPQLGDFQANLSEDPYNHTRNDLVQFSLELQITDSLKLSNLMTYDRDHASYGSGGLPSSGALLIGAVTDPQIMNGQAVNFNTSGTYSNLFTSEFSTETRLQSSFSGPLNFSVGALFLRLTRRDDVFVFDNLNQVIGGLLGLPSDPNGPTTASGGHRYFQSVNPYQLTSEAVFGEVTWRPNDEFSIIGGLRYTHDHKLFHNNDSAGNLLTAGSNPAALQTPGFGFLFTGDDQLTFNEVTGRLVANWTPHLSFTDRTLIYASYSRGYKGGGFNPPNFNVVFPPFAPEFVDAFEVGTKNDLFGRTLQLNLTGFYYNYQNYQFTQAAQFGTLTSNVDAHIYGVEFESIWRPIDNLALNAQVGFLHTSIQDGPTAQSIDQYNPTGGNPSYFAIRNVLGTVCLVNPTNFGNLLTAAQQNTPSGAGLRALLIGAPGSSLCDATGVGATTAAAFNLFAGIPTADHNGVVTGIAGNRLPNVPDWTVALGAQYTFHVGDNWTLTPRADYHYTGDFYTDLFNDEDDHVRGYSSGNATLTLAQTGGGLSFQAFAKNIAARNTIIGAAQGGGPITGSYRSVVLMDPTTYGISATAHF